MARHPSYELFEELGRGESSIVYRGYDLNLGREVAIKELALGPQTPENRTFARKAEFLKEAAFLAQFEHEHVLRVYSIEKEQGWIVMELMKGTLASQIAQKPMPAETVRSVLRQILTALEFLHGKAKVHGAVRPTNILINEHGAVKLSDFEQSNVDGELRVPGGSKKYLAPELIRAEYGEFGPSVDLYCLGFTALELLTGPKFDALFPGTGPGAIDADVAWLRWHSSPDSLPSATQMVPGCPEDLARVIDQTLVKQVEERPQSAQELLSLLDDKPLVSVPVPAMTTGQETVVAPSMLPADAQLRELSPPSSHPLIRKETHREAAAGKRTPSVPKRSPNRSRGVATRDETARDKWNRLLGRPYVLWPLCAAILLAALLVGWQLNQTNATPTETVEAIGESPVQRIAVHLNILPDATETTVRVDGDLVETQDGSYLLKPGQRQLTVEKPGFTAYEKLLLISSDQRTFEIALSEIPINKGVTEVTTEAPKTGDAESLPEVITVEVAEPTNKVAETMKESVEDRPTVEATGKLVDTTDTNEEPGVGKTDILSRPTEILQPKTIDELVLGSKEGPETLVAVTVADSKELAKEFQGQAELVIDSGGFMEEISDVAFSPDGKWLAACGGKVVRLWETSSGDLVTTLRGDRSRTSYGSTNAVTFSPDGKHLLVGVSDYRAHGSIRIYATDNLDEIESLLPGHTSPCRKLCFSRDGQTMTSVDADGNIRIWDWTTRKTVHVIPPNDPSHPIFDMMTFPHDEPYLLGVDFEGPQVYSAAEGRRLSATDSMPALVRGWLVDIFNQLVKYPYGATREPRVLDFRLEQSVWAAAGVGQVEGKNRFWVGLWEAREPQSSSIPARQLGQYDGHRWTISCVAIGPNDLAASGDKFGEVHLWNYRTGERIFRFKGQGKPIYEVAFEDGSTRIALGTRPHPPATWKRNNYGDVSQVLDLGRRTLLDATKLDDLVLIHEQPKMGQAAVSVSRPADSPGYEVRLQSDGRTTRYQMTSGRNPTVFTLLESEALNVSRPVVFGDSEGLLALWDTAGDELKRAFIGHQSLVSAVSRSSNGKLLVSGSTDRTIRLWSLTDYRPTGTFDFKFENTSVTKVIPGTSSAQAGVQVGDQIQSIDGKSLTEMFDLMLLGEFDYLPGQIVPVNMKRGDQAYQYEMQLVPGYDFSEPLLNCYVGDDGQWIIWNPQGYYDASPGADALIGWHVNRGPEKSARFFKVQQFREQLYRPDIIDGILATGSLAEAIERVNTGREGSDKVVDLRQTDELARIHPPQVKFVLPEEGDSVSTATVAVKCDVESLNGLPITEVTLLHNGSLAKVFRPDTSQQRTMTIEYTVGLTPGENEISAIAANARSTSLPARRVVHCQGTEPASRPDAHVLAIGISQYQTDGSHITTLSSASADAQAFVDAVRGHANGQLYRNVHVKLLQDERATRPGILDGFEWLVKNVRSGDMVMIFIATNGLVDSRDNFYLATYDMSAERPRATAFAWRALTDTLRFDLPDCQRMLFLDVQPIAAARKSGMRNPLLDLAAPELGTVFLASNTLQESVIPSTEERHSFFTPAMLQTIQDQTFDTSPEDGNQLFDPTEIASGVAHRVRLATNDRQHPVFYAPEQIKRTNVLELLKNSP